MPLRMLLSAVFLLVLSQSVVVAEGGDVPRQVQGLGWTQTPPEDAVAVTLEAPRAYGLVVGDRFEHRIGLRVDESLQLETGSLPPVRNFAGGLERQRVRVETTEASGERHYEIRITYQIFDAPGEVFVRTVPAFTVALAGPGGRLDVDVPAWQFALSPLIGQAIDRTPGEGRMLPAIAPQPRDAETPLRGLLLSLTGGVGVAFLLWGLPLLRNGRQVSPFAGPLKELRRLRRERPGDAPDRAVRAMHRALNELAGETVFRRTLPTLLEREPWLQPAKPDLLAFFDQSARAFYSDRNDPAGDEDAVDDIHQLLRHCRQLERRR